MRRNYYYLVAGLQDIVLDISKLNYDQAAFLALLRESLHPVDFGLVKKLFLPYDNKNLLNILQDSGEPFHPKGNYSLEELEEGLREGAGLPVYMKKFLNSFRSDETLWPGISRENELTTLFYEEMLTLGNGFLRDWFRFDLHIRNITTALISRKHDFPYADQILGHDEVSEIIRKSHLRDFGLGSEPEYAGRIMELLKTEDVQTREKSIDSYRWHYLDEATVFEYFTIEKILAFVIKLGLAERWLAMDKEQGEEMFRKLMDELQEHYSLPASFTEK